MGISAGSGRVTADVSGSVTTGLLPVSFAHLSNATSGSTTVGTVPAGKVWRIIGFNISCGGNLILTVTGGGVTYFTLLGAPEKETQVGFSGSYFDTLTAGETIEKVNSAAVTTCVTVFYVEEAA